MIKCVICKTELEEKSALKMPVQFSNPAIAIINTSGSFYCSECKDYSFTTEQLKENLNKLQELPKEKSDSLKIAVYE